MMSLCMTQKFSCRCSLRNNVGNQMKFFMQVCFCINWGILSENLLAEHAAIHLFVQILLSLYLINCLFHYNGSLYLKTEGTAIQHFLRFMQWLYLRINLLNFHDALYFRCILINIEINAIFICMI